MKRTQEVWVRAHFETAHHGMVFVVIQDAAGEKHYIALKEVDVRANDPEVEMARIKLANVDADGREVP